MPYASEAELAARLGGPLYARLTDRDDATTPDANQGALLLVQGEALLNSYVGRRYAVPIDTSTNASLAALLRVRTLDLAEYLAWRQSPFVSDVPARVTQLGREVFAFLQQVATGQLDLPGPPPSAAASGSMQVRATPRRFTHEELDQL